MTLISAQPIQATDVDGLLDVLSDYADQQADLDRQAKRNTLATALATQELYESGVWVAEWLEQKPPPKRPSNNFKPAGLNRFQQWQKWRNEQRGRRAMGSMTTYRMYNAATVAAAIPTFPYEKVDATQPILAIDWLRKNGYLAQAPEVWRLAVDMAGSVDRVTEEHTKSALAQWKHDTFTGRGAASRAGNNDRMHSKRVKAEAVFDDLLFLAGRAENGRAELQAFLDHVKAKVEERRR